MPERTTRSELLRTALVTGGGVAVGGVVIAALPDLAGSKPSAAQDAEILNFALLLEHVQAGLYADALRRKALSGELRQFAEIVGAHERAHIAFIRKALGDKRPQTPQARLRRRHRDGRVVHGRRSQARGPRGRGL